MKHIFARHPILEFENYSLSHQEAGEAYHRRFSVMPGRALMWELERECLKEIVSTADPRKILDFACGTGRIASFLETALPESEIFGIDVSNSMLKIARTQSVRADFQAMDSRAAVAHYGDRFFNVVLAFRFFANAEPALRESVAADLCRLVADDGLIVINNHRNFWSTSYFTRRLLGQPPLGALNREIEEVFRKQGLRIRRRISLGVWPQGETNASLLPWSAVGVIERANRSWLATHHALGYNVIWVISKT